MMGGGHFVNAERGWASRVVVTLLTVLCNHSLQSARLQHFYVFELALTVSVCMSFTCVAECRFAQYILNCSCLSQQTMAIQHNHASGSFAIPSKLTVTPASYKTLENNNHVFIASQHILFSYIW